MIIAEPKMRKIFTLLTIACASLFLLPSCAKSLEQEAKQQLIKTLQEHYGKQIELKKVEKRHASDSLCWLYVVTERAYQDAIDSSEYRPWLGPKESLRVTATYDYVYINMVRKGKRIRKEALASHGIYEKTSPRVKLNPESESHLERDGYDALFLSRGSLTDIRWRYREFIDKQYHLDWRADDYDDKFRFIVAQLIIRSCGRTLP